LLYIHIIQPTSSTYCLMQPWHPSAAYSASSTPYMSGKISPPPLDKKMVNASDKTCPCILAQYVEADLNKKSYSGPKTTAG
jgi:hypothetical protein